MTDHTDNVIDATGKLPLDLKWRSRWPAYYLAELEKLKANYAVRRKRDEEPGPDRQQTEMWARRPMTSQSTSACS